MRAGTGFGVNMAGDVVERAGGTQGAEAAAVVIAAPSVLTGVAVAAGGMPEMRPVAPVIKAPLSYMQKVLIAVGVAAAAVLLAMLLYQLAHLVVLCFAGLLWAVFLSAPSDLLAKYAGIRRSYALGLVLLGLLMLVVGGGYFIGRTVIHQTEEMSRTLSGAWQQLKNDLESRLPAEPAEEEHKETTATASAPASSVPASEPAPETSSIVVRPSSEEPPRRPQNWVGDKLTQLWNGATDFFFSESFVRQAGGVAGNVVTSTFGVVGDMLIVFGVGLFFAINPKLYARGIVRLSPLSRRVRAAAILTEVGTQLEWWFVGQLCSMVSIGILTFIGLKMLGMPMAVTLAILAGLLNIIPNFGPIIAAAPAVLIAFAPQGDQTQLRPALAGWVMLMYYVIQMLEGWVITPFFQQRAVELPPGLIVIAQVAFAILLGPIGLILATPILAATMVLVRMIYVEDVLGDMEG
jgi:predicted PurR-regulated permease PerM